MRIKKMEKKKGEGERRRKKKGSIWMIKTRSDNVNEEIKPTISVIGTSLIEKGSYVVSTLKNTSIYKFVFNL